jgi:hypothetical protein
MTGWEIKDLMDAQEEAQKGDSSKIDDFVSKYPLSYVNNDYSLFIIIRGYAVNILRNGERRTLNCKPAANGDAQWGVEISSYKNGEGCASSKSIPAYDYEKISANEKGEIIIASKQKTVVTNKIEIARKLQFIGDEQKILENFNSLCNETYAPIKPLKATLKTLKTKTMGVMKYDKKIKWYESSLDIGGVLVSVYIDLAEKETLLKIVENADRLMGEKFYKKAMEAMRPSMLKLKNETWLGEDDDGNDERALTIEEFESRVKLNSIVFCEDGSAQIDCLDDDIFYGHFIVIDTDENGVYKDANLGG